MSRALNVLPFSGIRPDSLGNYLVSLGLLAAVSQHQSAIRGCWRNGSFSLVGDGVERAGIESYLLNEWSPTAYERWWAEVQKKDTKAKTDRGLWSMRSSQEDIAKVRLLDAHIVGSRRNQFNPVLGTGGNVGKRVFAIAYEEARALLRKAKEEQKTAWLASTLDAGRSNELPSLNNAGTWFVYANKTFNSGQDWYREGEISPWSFLLALEGAILLVGGIGRRLSAKARPYAVFPFVAEASAPASEGEIGLAKAEFWAPLWEYPATLSEIRALLERGQARIGQRVAKAPHEFAVAAMAAGVDAGVATFARFVLRQTTSSQVYEAIPKEHVRISEATSQESKLIEPLLSWMDRLPFEPSDSKQRGKFKGLRGPIEQAIVRVAARPNDPEEWQRMLLLLADAQGRIDHNKSLRGRCRALPFLNQAWFEKCWPAPAPEILAARAIASIGASTETPLIVNVYGVAPDKYGNPNFSGEQRPQRVVWHNGQPLRVLADVLERRLVDTDAAAPLPFAAARACAAETFAAFVSRAVDYDLIMRWIPPLSLIKWERQHADGQPTKDQTSQSSPNGTSLLLSLFRPLFYPSVLWIGNDRLFPKHLLPSAVTARRLLNLIRQESWDEAIQLARGRYVAAGRATVSTPSGIRADGELLAAALLVPLSANEIAADVRRWLQPNKQNEK